MHEMLKKYFKLPFGKYFMNLCIFQFSSSAHEEYTWIFPEYLMNHTRSAKV